MVFINYRGLKFKLYQLCYDPIRNGKSFGLIHKFGTKNRQLKEDLLFKYQGICDNYQAYVFCTLFLW